ncbi:MAG: bifunctional alpha,alpha-trehalose-phosphate synthase (UDP-forming)/trehalose-phosphatase [Bacillota bacterium]
MQRLILVSNRLPVNVNKNKKGEFEYEPSSGGLATGLSSVYKNYEGFWMGWPGIAEDELSEKEKYKMKNELKENDNYPVFLDQNELDNYYYGFCNRTLWPLFHYFTQYTKYPEEYWKIYKEVNIKFFKELKDKIKPGDNIWVHDYHLMLLPEMIRREFPEVKIGFFLHIPFPSSEIFRLLPWKEEILEGLLGSDIVAFHTYGYVRHFLSSVVRILGYDKNFNEIQLKDRTVKAELFPMGIDYEKYSKAPHSKAAKNEIENIKERVGNTKIILSVDRMDYTKGIPQRLRAFDYFLENNPEYKGKVTLIIIAVPSRTKIEKYEELKTEVNELVGDINGKYGTLNWIPVWFLFKSVPFERLVSLYNMADVCLVTPLRDGMNLVSKEFIAASDDKGVLVLSEMAGSAHELSKAINITPTRKEEIAYSIKKALEMPEKEQKERLDIMKKRIKNYDVKKWANTFVNDLMSSEKLRKEKSFDKKAQRKLIEDFSNSNERLIIVDLHSFIEKENTITFNWLKKISENNKNKLILLSRLSKKELINKFFDYNSFIFAEYGKYFYDGNDWQDLNLKEAEWMEDIDPIIELHKENTPGATVEKTVNSIKWSFAEAEPELAEMRKRELKDNLRYFSEDFDINIVEGEKFIEIKSSSIKAYNKIYDIIQSNDFNLSLFIGNLNRYPKIEDTLISNNYIFELKSNNLENSYKIEEVRDLLKVLYSN